MEVGSPSSVTPSTWPAWIRILGGMLFSLVLILSGVQFYLAAPGSAEWLGKFSPKWAAGFALLCLAGLGATGLVWIGLLHPQRLARPVARLAALRSKWLRSASGSRTWLSWLLALAALTLPAGLLLFTPPGDLLSGAFVRLTILLASAGVFAYLICAEPAQLGDLPGFASGLVLAAAIHITLERLSSVTAYPFALGWSEGNRLFDYWMVVNQSGLTTIPPVAVPDTYRLADAGRGWLWGIWFLIPNTPIWLHRLWNSALWVLPYLVVGLGLASLAHQTRLRRWIFATWVFVFLFQGPVYPSLLISAALIAFLVRPGHWWRSILAILPASYYAALSRWTWLPASAAWGAMILLADFRWKRSEGYPLLVRRLAIPAAAGLLGLAGGALANNRMISPEKLNSSMALSQPRLWERLLPNVNYPEGLLAGLALATLPLVVLLVWLVWSRRWELNWVQVTAYLAVTLFFLCIGLFASVKIGGGNNLHNLDMLLVSLAVLAALALRAAQNGLDGLNAQALWPAWARAVLLLACLLPSWSAVRLGSPLHLPPDEQTQTALQTIQEKVRKAGKRGAVLFIDQRQLLIFGAIQGPSLAPDYEKKYLMDKAMAGDAVYFDRFYADLRNQRFAMIITEPLYDRMQAADNSFQQENNAWVQWVARPLLCYYVPIETLPTVRTQLLLPRSNPQGCP